MATATEGWLVPAWLLWWLLALTPALSPAVAATAAPTALNTAARVERAALQHPYRVIEVAQAEVLDSRRHGDEAAELLALRHLIRSRSEVDELKGLSELIARAKTLSTARSDKEAMAELLLAEALAADDMHDAPRAEQAYIEAERFAAEHARLFHWSRALIQHARWEVGNGRYASALERLSKAHAMATGEQDAYAISRSLAGMASTMLYVDRFSASRMKDVADQFRAALAAVDLTAYPVYEAKMMNNLALALREQGLRDEARRAMETALDVAERLALVRLERDFVAVLAEIDLEENRAKEALARVQRILPALADPQISPRTVFRYAIIRAGALSALGDRDGAGQALVHAESQLPGLKASRFRVQYFETAVAVNARLGDFQAAHRFGQQLRAADIAANRERNDATLAELRTKFDAERHERENAALKAREQALEARRWVSILALTSLVLLLAGIGLWSRARLLRRLATAQALKAAIVDHSIGGIIVADEHGRVIEFNPAAEAMFGYRRAEVLGSPFLTLVPERFHERQRQIQEDLNGPAASKYIGRPLGFRARRADGTEFPAEGVLWRSGTKGSVTFTISLRDVSEQRRNAEMIERQRHELRQSEKLTLLGSLLAGVAHELNNPLAIVVGRSSLLEELGKGTPMEVDARRVHEAAMRCGRVVRTFLNMARQRESAPAMVQVNDIVKAVVEMLGYVLRTNAIKVDVQLDAQLPQVLADGDQLGQVVLNLVVNAQQAMAELTEPRKLSLQTGQTGANDGTIGRVWVRVVDSGPGISPELAERVFDPFFTTKADVGTGLGLSVSRSIARKHGGDLLLEPSASGAAFLLWLPAFREPAKVRAEAIESAP